MRNIIGIGVVVLIVILLIGRYTCRTKTTRSALQQGDKLKASIESFEKNRSKLSEKVIESLQEAEEGLTEEDPNLAKVSKDFESEWTGIQNRYRKLKNDFAEVGQSSEDYFNKLAELSGSISDEQLRQQEMAKNEELEMRWQSTYQKAAINIEKVEAVLESGHDFHMVLVASSIRQKLEQNVEELNRIATQAQELLNELETFTQAGRQLVEG